MNESVDSYCTHLHFTAAAALLQAISCNHVADYCDPRQTDSVWLVYTRRKRVSEIYIPVFSEQLVLNC